MSRPTPGCPCGSGLALASCCGPRLDGSVPAETAEALMRSRYTAYATRDAGYVFRTWHPRTRPDEVTLDDTRWTGLEVLRVEAGGADDATGVVEFVATWRSGRDVGRLHEVSRFEQRARRWLYVDGDH